jgi:hypothetical protein
MQSPQRLMMSLQVIGMRGLQDPAGKQCWHSSASLQRVRSTRASIRSRPRHDPPECRARGSRTGGRAASPLALRSGYEQQGVERISTTEIRDAKPHPDRQLGEETGWPGSSQTQDRAQLSLARRVECEDERVLHSHLRWRSGCGQFGAGASRQASRESRKASRGSRKASRGRHGSITIRLRAAGRYEQECAGATTLTAVQARGRTNAILPLPAPEVAEQLPHGVCAATGTAEATSKARPNAAAARLGERPRPRRRVM